MPATPEEFERLIDESEEGAPTGPPRHADLLLRGNVILEEHEMLDGPIGDAFEAFVFRVLNEHGIGKEAFAETLIALSRLRETIDHLDQLPP